MAASGLRRARVAATVCFFVTGLVSATWSARIPAVQDRLGLSPGGLAVAVLAIEAGAVAGLPVGGALVARLGSRRSLRLGFVAFPSALVVAAVMPALAALAAGLAVWALANSVIDVAMNAQGAELERRCDRPLLSGLHSAHSFGLLAGGAAAAAAAAGGVSLPAHAALVAALTLPCGVAACRWLVEDRRRERRSLLARPDRRLLLLGLTAFCAFLVDGSATNWAAVHLRTEHHAGAALAAVGFSAFALAVALGRLAGDAVVRHAGRVATVRAAGTLTAAGAALAVVAPSLGLAVAGWAIIGAGLAVVAPAVLGAAPSAARAPSGVAIAAVTTIGYLGSFTGPPLIGALAETIHLSAALGLLVVAGAVISLLARPALRTAPEAPSRSHA